MKTNEAGVALIKKYEGCRLKAYKLSGEKYNTIGYGHYGPDVTDGMTITQEQADQMLAEDLVKYEKAVEKYCTIPLTPNRNAALVSYTYNRGQGGMKQLAQNCHSIRGYSEGIVKYWGSATRYKDALIKRRKAEQALFDKDAVGGTKSIREVALEVLDGCHGNGDVRRANLTREGYNYAMVQAEVNKILEERKAP